MVDSIGRVLESFKSLMVVARETSLGYIRLEMRNDVYRIVIAQVNCER